MENFFVVFVFGLLVVLMIWLGMFGLNLLVDNFLLPLIHVL